MSEHSDDQRRNIFWFFLIAFVVLAAGYGLRDPWPADEPRFVLVAKQMFESGDWLFPHRGIELYPDKPPLYFWLLDACYALIRSWRWSFLLPSLLAGLGTLWLTLDLGRRLWHPRAGLWAAIAVLASVQFVYQFKRAQIDPTLVFFTTLAFYGLCRHLLLGPHWRWFWIGCGAAGLGVVAKGVGFLPLLALLPFAVMASRQWQGLAMLGSGNGWRWYLGGLVFLAAIALWLAPMLTLALAGRDAEHAAYLHNLLYRQTAQRYADPWHHQEPFWYFLEVIALFWLPFSLAFPWLWKCWARAWRERDARVWLPLAWALMVLLFFSASSGKRDMYLLPALPAFALAAAPFLAWIATQATLRDALPEAIARRAPGLARFSASVRSKHILFVFVLLLGGLLLALGVAGCGHARFAERFIAERGIGAEVRWLWWMLTAVGVATLLAALFWRAHGALRSCAWALVLVWFGYGFVAHPVLDASSSARDVMQRARDVAGAKAEIGLVDWKEQNLLQAVGPTAEFGFLQPVPVQLAAAVRWQRAAANTRLLLVQRSEQTHCLDFASPAAVSVATANRRDWWLIGAAAATRCPVDAPVAGGSPTP